MLLKKRTPVWKIRLRFYLIFSPLPIIFYTMFGNLGGIMAITSLIVMSLFLAFLRVSANLAVKKLDPTRYYLLKQLGVDPFYNSLAWPFNPDSESVREQGLVANAVCPHCGGYVILHEGRQTACACGLTWSDGGWWQWSGLEWRPYYGPFESTTQTQQVTQPVQNDRTFWTGESTGTT